MVQDQSNIFGKLVSAKQDQEVLNETAEFPFEQTLRSKERYSAKKSSSSSRFKPSPKNAILGPQKQPQFKKSSSRQRNRALKRLNTCNASAFKTLIDDMPEIQLQKFQSHQTKIDPEKQPLQPTSKGAPLKKRTLSAYRIKRRPKEGAFAGFKDDEKLADQSKKQSVKNKTRPLSSYKRLPPIKPSATKGGVQKGAFFNVQSERYTASEFNLSTEESEFLNGISKDPIYETEKEKDLLKPVTPLTTKRFFKKRGTSTRSNSNGFLESSNSNVSVNNNPPNLKLLNCKANTSKLSSRLKIRSETDSTFFATPSCKNFAKSNKLLLEPSSHPFQKLARKNSMKDSFLKSPSTQSRNLLLGPQSCKKRPQRVFSFVKSPNDVAISFPPPSNGQTEAPQKSSRKNHCKLKNKSGALLARRQQTVMEKIFRPQNDSKQC